MDPEENDFSKPDPKKVKDLFNQMDDGSKEEILWNYMQSRNFNISHQATLADGTFTETLVSKVVNNNSPNAFQFLLQHGADVNYMFYL